jgi:nicotinamidase-related amidase
MFIKSQFLYYFFIFASVGFRQGAPEVSATTSAKSFAEGKARFAGIDMEQWLKIHPSLLPLEGEVTVTKRRVSAFTGSDLEVVLRAFNVRHLILTGFSTSGVVLSTVCDATDRDFQLTVLNDGVADPDAEIHNILLSKYFPKRAAVMSIEQWVGDQSIEEVRK